MEIKKEPSRKVRETGFLLINLLSAFLEIHFFQSFIVYVWELGTGKLAHIAAAILLLIPFMIYGTILTIPLTFILKLCSGTQKRRNLMFYLLSAGLAFVLNLFYIFEVQSLALSILLTFYSLLLLLKGYEIVRFAFSPQ